MAESNHTSCRIVVLISGNGSNLQALIDAQARGILPGTIVSVISNRPDVFGLERATKASIPAITLDHKEFDSRETFDQALQARIDEHQPDLVVLAGFMRILTPEFVRHYHGRMLNIHPSLLPKYQGLHTHRRALEAGDQKHGVTVHFVTEELDGGPNILQAEVPILPGDTPEVLAARVQLQEHLIYPEAVRWFCEGRLVMENNAALLDNNVLAPSGISFANTEA
ncbi:phosphoribosylglycinamide formyltransferase [Hahella sp. CCB-MM4]|uniref:phosphoribosylglycinamide formyltransferase n=1 Tax=Hahella sp. (strain CCB-MM4) TaxID=1926491 RepID=UPI000B9B1675|nr:phosphoribosylglycinamide formyltransferase [Hahella sp. CCB-MM4]OZG72488.1 phosphoribosylglycinamide formyltransferase [Hahella sp. CCB-MM4]